MPHCDDQDNNLVSVDQARSGYPIISEIIKLATDHDL